jgi:hypothetical protein
LALLVLSQAQSRFGVLKRAIIGLLAVGLGLVVSTQAGGSPAPAPKTVSFKKDVAPILAVSCSTVSCHGGGLHSPDLDPRADASKVRRALVGVASEERNGRAYVKPRDARASWLLDKVDGRLVDAECVDHDCGVRMPARNAPLSDAQRTLIRAWIDQGAQDN